MLIFLLIGQTYSLINYEHSVSLNLQESVIEVTPVGVAWAKAFAFGDTVFYIPMLIVGIVGFLKRKKWGYYSLFGSLAISVYWPIVNLSAMYIGKTAMQLNPEKYILYPIVLSVISIYGLWGMWYLYVNKENLIT